MPAAAELGNRIRTFRERLGLAPEDLASKAGVAPELVSAAEAGRAYPAVGFLQKIARALGQRLGTFMDDQYGGDPVIVRGREAPGSMATHRGAIPQALRYVSLGRGKTDRHMEPFRIEIEPGRQEPPSAHEGEEFLLVLSGEVVLTYGKETHRLGPGDSMYYNSVVPHAVAAAGPETASLCAVVFQPI